MHGRIHAHKGRCILVPIAHGVFTEAFGYAAANIVDSAWFAVAALKSNPYAITTLVICMHYNKAAFHSILVTSASRATSYWDHS